MILKPLSNLIHSPIYLNCLRPVSIIGHKIARRTFYSFKCHISHYYYPSIGGCYHHTYDEEPYFIDFSGSITEKEKYDILKHMIVIEQFLNSDEEKSLLDEVEPYMKRLRYEFDHWDNAIHGFRETERLKWNEENTKIINRVRECAFPPNSPQLHHVHVLDLAEEGYIKPHIDSVRFCGNTIAGLSLLTDAVMRLVHDKEKTKYFDVLLKRCSLYIIRDSVRYDYTHEVLANNESVFKEEKIKKKRRISIICRNEPSNDS